MEKALEGDLKSMVETIAITVQQPFADAVLKTPIYRRHPVPYGKRIPPTEIELAMRDFCKDLLRRIAKRSPVDTAAWAERELDGQIHPFGDGCGRISKLVAAAVLMQYRRQMPILPTREIYYSAMEGTLLVPKETRVRAVRDYLAQHRTLAAQIAS